MYKNNELLGVGTSGAKMILIGEHSVVYNRPAIAMPFNGLQTKVSIYKTNKEITIDSIYHNGYLNDGKNIIKGIIKLVKHILDMFEKKHYGLHFNIESNIISQRGLGSSAAVSIAVTKALFDAFDKKIDDDLLIELATYAEMIHHTNPSGLDVATLVYQKPILFQREKGFETIDINFEGTMMIIDSGMMSQTKLAVEHVGMLHKTKTKYMEENFDKLTKLTNEALVSLTNNHIFSLGDIMNQAHQSLKNIEVSSQTLDDLVLKTVNLGALGAKLTGGGVGGCIIALTETTKDALKIKEQLIKDGITNVWISPLKELS